ncbi:hypothetical protein EXQ31_11885 [Clostridium botulinum]|uniref:Uncharacterized protein n=1 Tax=Clostridium botulinum TaxID=1491 RepID=A0A1L7JNH1_CLOBO|nr:hypothetical protein [Clostridium botulinum]AJE13435.1 hypothetical protein T259_4072 [Clostridium botulinum CDC_1436]APU87321.1 hypothetical protein NPD8_4118 [Clostridium botulinum]MBO0524978.1 hypothetical protein [Clostridium botulinum]MBO0528601.1 hypothetical protein [Clostridium botulinum]MBO0532635.1 hypothetical protein [Clostridium botulinum]
MSLKCICESILGTMDCWQEVSITKKNVIKKLCKKQIPQAPNFPYGHSGKVYCPNCAMIVEDLYCGTCGQKIKWD